MITATPTATIDVRDLSADQRAPTVLERFEALLPGQAMHVVDDRAPQDAQRALKRHAAGQYAWSAVESGPEVWRVRIRRIAPRIAMDSCCSGGNCAG